MYQVSEKNTQRATNATRHNFSWSLNEDHYENTTDDNIINQHQEPQFFSLSTTVIFLTSPKALCITGYIHNHPVTILIDFGSTHNIIQPRVVSFFKFTLKLIPEYPMMVGNDDNIKCNGICPELLIHLENMHFTIPFFCPRSQGCRPYSKDCLVMNTRPNISRFCCPKNYIKCWAQSYYPKRRNPNILCIQPTTQNPNPNRQNRISSCSVLSHQHNPHPKKDTILAHPNLTIQYLLHKYRAIFEVPKQLPPSWSQDHHVSTIPTAAQSMLNPTGIHTTKNIS